VEGLLHWNDFHIKGLENIKAHLKLSFVRDKYIPLKREYIKSLNGRSNVQLMVAKYGV
jgi:hypothetical protein